MKYSYERDEEDMKWESLNNFRDDDKSLILITEQPIIKASIAEQDMNKHVETTDQTFIKW